MTSHKQSQRYPIIGIPVEVYDLCSQCVDEYHAPTVNAVLQDALQEFVEGGDIYLALFVTDEGLLFHHSELKRVRLTKGQFDLVRSLQRYFASEHRFHVHASDVITSLVLQMEDDSKGWCETISSEHISLHAVGEDEEGNWKTWPSTRALWKEGKYTKWHALKAVVDGD